MKLFHAGYYVKKYQKSNEQKKVITSFLSDFIDCFYKRGGTAIAEFDAEAQKIHSVSKDIEPGKRVVKHWFRGALVELVLSSIETVQNIDRKERLIDSLKKYFEINRWDYQTACKNSPLSSLESVVVVPYLKSEYADCGNVRCVVYDSNEFPIGSKWVSNSGKVWTVVKCMDSRVLVNGVDRRGNKKNLSLVVNCIRRMERVF